MVPAILFAILDKPLMLTAMVIPCFIAVCILNMDKLQSFRAGDFEAQFREQVQQVEQVIEEAHATIDQLKAMTTPLLDYSLANIIGHNRITGVSAYDKKLFYEKALENISNFDIQEEHTLELLDAVKRQVAVTYLEELELQSETGEWDENAPVREFFNRFHLGELSSGRATLPSSSTLSVFYDEHPQHDSKEIREKIEDYAQFLNTHF